MSAEELLEAEVLIYLRGLGFMTDRRPAPQEPQGKDQGKKPAEPPPVPPSETAGGPPPGPWGRPK
jgi:hypothetical protein